MVFDFVTVGFDIFEGFINFLANQNTTNCYVMSILSFFKSVAWNISYLSPLGWVQGITDITD